jgi:hypothetical protein
LLWDFFSRYTIIVVKNVPKLPAKKIINWVLCRWRKRTVLRYSKNYLQLFGIFVFSAGFAAGIFLTMAEVIIPRLFAATSPWTQTDWSSGVGSSTTNQYSSSSNIDATGTAGQLTLTTAISLTNLDFETDVSGWIGGVLPSSLTGSDLKLWLKADAITGLNDGDAITTWSDSSGNGYDLTQSTAGYKPLYKTDIQNSLPAVRFDGSDDSLKSTTIVNSAALTGDPPLSIYLVYKRNNSKGSLSFTGNAGGLWGDSFDYNSGVVSSGSLAGYKIWMYTKSPGVINPNGKIYKNGALSVSGYGTNITPSISAGNVFFLGGWYAQNNSGYALDGDISEVIIYKSVLSDANRALIDAYLQGKYAISSGFVTIARDTNVKYAGSGSAKLTAGATGGNFNQSINLGNTASYNFQTYAYTNGSAITSADVELFYNGSTISTTYTSVGDGWYLLSGTVTGANESRLFGVQVKANKTVYVDNFSLGYVSGTLTSNIFDIGFAADWGNLTYTNSGSGTVTVKVRTSDSATMEGATDWASCVAKSSGADLTGGCVTDSQRYVQYQVTLESSGTNSPTFSDISIAFTASDQVQPNVNASSLAMSTSSSNGRSVADTGWNNGVTPYFSWTGGSDSPTNTSGFKGYCLYLGTDSDADPGNSITHSGTSGLLTNSPVVTTGTDCSFITSDTNLNLSSASYLSSSLAVDTTYYFRIKVIDNAGNTFDGDPASFSFVHDSTAPTNVSYITAPTGNLSNVTDMFFTWPIVGNGVATDSASLVLGWQYQINSSTGTWQGTTQSSTLGLDYIPATASAYYLITSRDGSGIVNGANIIYLRTVDNAGNPSSSSTYRTASLSYGGAAPSFGYSCDAATTITVTPDTSTTNSFALSWPVASASGSYNVAKYYYMINTSPPSSLSTIQNNSSTYINNGTARTVSTSALTSVNKGTNYVYVVAIDDATTPNYSSSNCIKGTFTLNSTDPDNVGNLVASDSSIKATSQWNITLTWSAPTYQGAGNLTYLINRSTDNVTFTQVGTTSGLSYVDNTPSSDLYYYKVYTKDGANAQSSGTNAVSITPTGKWTTAPTLDTGPDAGSITVKKATITWTTSRTSDSKIQYGTTSGSYNTVEPSSSTQVSSHSIQLTGLNPGTTYYYKAKWTDEDGNTGTSDEHSFSTASAPVAKNITVSSISLSSGLINYTVTGASSVKIYYGTTTSFGGSTTVSTSTSETAYTTQLTGLLDGTKYYYKINTFDSDGSEYDGSVLDFTTLPRPKITDVTIQQVTNTAQSTILVTWTTNTDVSSIVTYYPDGNTGEARDEVNVALTKGEHRMIIRGLLPQTNYILIVKGRDKVGNEATSDSHRLTTATDTRPPQISELHVEGSSVTGASSNSQDQTTQLVVSWNTDEPGTSQVEFGEGTGTTYSSKTQEDSNLTSNHLVIISGLTPSKVYHLRAISKDKAGNTGNSIDTVTITPKMTENALNLVISNLQQAFGFLGGLRQ